MQSEFNIVLNSFHPISISLPGLGDVQLPAQQDVQLLHASVDTVNYLRNTFSGTGVKVTLNKKSERPFMTYDYKKKVEEDQKEKVQEKVPVKNETPFEKVANYELPLGKHKGKKVRELDDDVLKQIAKMTKNQAVKSAIEAYLMLK